MMYQRKIYESPTVVAAILLAGGFAFYPIHGWLSIAESTLDKGRFNVWRAKIVPNLRGHSIQMQIVHSEKKS